jgi:hypothetical protein
MSYAVDVDPLAEQQISALPIPALHALAEAIAVLNSFRGTACRSTSATPEGPYATSRSGSSG